MPQSQHVQQRRTQADNNYSVEGIFNSFQQNNSYFLTSMVIFNIAVTHLKHSITF